MSRRRARPGARNAVDVVREIRESRVAHLVLGGMAVVVVMGALVRTGLGGGLLAWAVIVFGALALAQAVINYRKLGEMLAQVEADPDAASRLHGIPRVPFLQGLVGRRD